MTRTLLLAAILTGCSGIPDEEFYAASDVAGCWTVDGEPHVYLYVPAGQELDAELKQECDALRRAAQSHRRSGVKPSPSGLPTNDRME